MLCRFEDRLAGRACGWTACAIEARAAAEVGPALQAIEAERRQGRWVALMLDYELGEWLLPEAARAAPAGLDAAGRRRPATAARAGLRRQDRRSALGLARPGRARRHAHARRATHGRGRLPAPHRRDPRPDRRRRAVPGQLHPAAGPAPGRRSGHAVPPHRRAQSGGARRLHPDGERSVLSFSPGTVHPARRRAPDHPAHEGHGAAPSRPDRGRAPGPRAAGQRRTAPRT